MRTREVGIQDIHHRVRPDEVELIRRDYTANNGWETFLEYGDPRQDILMGLLRLRKISGVDGVHEPHVNVLCCMASLHLYCWLLFNLSTLRNMVFDSHALITCIQTYRRSK